MSERRSEGFETVFSVRQIQESQRRETMERNSPVFVDFEEAFIRVHTPCPRKNCTPVYVAITLANNVGF